MPYTDYGYLDPIHIVWRKGTSDDPYILRTEFLKVVNQTVILSEVPDKVYRVRISGLKEINYEMLTSKKLLENEFYVDYSIGIIQLHPNIETNTLSVTYKGRGFIQYPSDRIYHQDKFNNVVSSLKDIIERTKGQTDLVDFKFRELEDVLVKAEVAIIKTNDATDEAGKATEKAIVATELALEAYDTTKLVFKRYVNEFSEIAVAYPNPQVGWTVSVYETGERFRYDGIEWIPIDAIGGAVPDATELNGGLLTKEDFVKLRDISEYTDVMVMTFVIPDDVLHGIQSPKLTFGVEGEILDVCAYVGTKGLVDTPIDIQTSKNYEDWTSIIDFPMLIEGGFYEDNKNHNVILKDVEPDDKYRIVVSTFVADVRDLQVVIKMKKLERGSV